MAENEFLKTVQSLFDHETRSNTPSNVASGRFDRDMHNALGTAGPDLHKEELGATNKKKADEQIAKLQTTSNPSITIDKSTERVDKITRNDEVGDVKVSQASARNADEIGSIQRGPAIDKGSGGKVQGAGTGNDMKIRGTLTIQSNDNAEIEAQADGVSTGG